MVYGKLGRYPIEIYIKFTENIFHECCFSYIWDGQNFTHEDWLKAVIKQRLMDPFFQNWLSKIIDSANAINYIIFKTKFEFEEYLNVLEYKKCVGFLRIKIYITIHNYYFINFIN